MPELIRSFIAIELPDATRSELRTLQDTLKARRFDFVRWTDPDSIHLTLKFLGDISSDLVPSVLGAIRKATQGGAPFNLHLHGLGAFPNLQRPRVVWVGVGGDLNMLIAVQKSVDISLRRLDFVPEDRAFSPHLTLGRVRDNAGPEDRLKLGKFIASVPFTEGSSFTAGSVSLMKSVLTPGGSIYSRLGEVPLERTPLQ